MCCVLVFGVFFFKQKTAYEMRISDWSSDVCSSDLRLRIRLIPLEVAIPVTIDEFRRRLRLPVIAAPMFLVSGPELVIAACKSGISASLPTLNTRSTAEFERWLQRIEQELEEASAQGQAVAPYAVNLIVQDTGSPRFVEDLALIRRYKPPLVITSVGQAGDVVRLVHDYGGLVFHDIATLRHASKAIGWGVDGLILLTAGAGGHTGHANAFAIRSEEHTSELQSPMRNSYAVFCLKQNNS